MLLARLLEMLGMGLGSMVVRLLVFVSTLGFAMAMLNAFVCLPLLCMSMLHLLLLPCTVEFCMTLSKVMGIGLNL